MLALLFLLGIYCAISVLFLFVVMLLQLTRNEVVQFYMLDAFEEREKIQLQRLFLHSLLVFLLYYLFI